MPAIRALKWPIESAPISPSQGKKMAAGLIASSLFSGQRAVSLTSRNYGCKLHSCWRVFLTLSPSLADSKSSGELMRRP